VRGERFATFGNAVKNFTKWLQNMAPLTGGGGRGNGSEKVTMA
jgi:hypothetical protein